MKNNFPSLDELLDYGEEYDYPDLIMDDYFREDKSRKKQSNQQNDSDSPNQEQNVESSDDGSQAEMNSEEQTGESEQEIDSDEQTEDSKQEIDSDEQTNETDQEIDSEKQFNEADQEIDSEEQINEADQEIDSEEQSGDSEREFDSDEQTDESQQEIDSDEQTDDSDEQDDEAEADKDFNFEEQSDEFQQEKNSEEENDFDDLMDNYDDEINKKDDENTEKELSSPSNKLNDITPTKVYKIFKKLVSLSYERYQKGTYRYNKKEIVKHYLTNQKFRILDDLISPTFKPDVFVFDLSPSNDNSLEMYVNAISSVAVKDSIIYLTFNSEVLKKLIIKKNCHKSINVQDVANSSIKKYASFDCVSFKKYQSLYAELREIKDRKIYVFSDFDISMDMEKLSQENKDIVWFSTENNHGMYSFYREYPSNYAGYYVETADIKDIEKFVYEKNKEKYRGRSHNG